MNTASGDVEVDFVGGDLRVNSASGDVDHRRGRGRRQDADGFRRHRDPLRLEGKIDIQSASGDVEVGIRRGSTVYIDASSMSGDMTSEMDVSDAPPESDGPDVDFRARTMSGDVKVRRA